MKSQKSLNQFGSIGLFDGYNKDGKHSWTYIFNGGLPHATKTVTVLSSSHAIYTYALSVF